MRGAVNENFLSRNTRKERCYSFGSDIVRKGIQVMHEGKEQNGRITFIRKRISLSRGVKGTGNA
jgi:hypothetical protein